VIYVPERAHCKREIMEIAEAFRLCVTTSLKPLDKA
jgi:hypothetical protein